MNNELISQIESLRGQIVSIAIFGSLVSIAIILMMLSLHFRLSDLEKEAR